MLRWGSVSGEEREGGDPGTQGPRNKFSPRRIASEEGRRINSPSTAGPNGLGPRGPPTDVMRRRKAVFNKIWPHKAQSADRVSKMYPWQLGKVDTEVSVCGQK